MASTPTNTPDPTQSRKDSEEDMFMREVDEAVRQDDAANFMKKYGWPLGIGLVLALAAFAGFLFWQGQSEASLEDSSEQLVGALDELEAGNAKVADEELAALIADGEPGAVAMARMIRAGIALGENRPEDAATLYNEVIDNPEVPSEVRDLALVRLMTARYDETDPQVVIDRLGPLAVPENAFFGSAGELVAFAYLAQDKQDEAGALLAQIAKNKDVPQSIRSRTRQLAGLLGHDAIEDVDEMLEELAEDAPQ